MDSQTFVKELESSNQVWLAKLAEPERLAAGPSPVEVRQLLQVALANEISVSELAAAWMPSARELDVKMALAQQTGDEATHFLLVESRLQSLGISTENFVAPAVNPLFAYLRSLENTVERIAAGQFTLESIAYRVNEMFMKYCEQLGDLDTVKLYQNRIQPDELHHHHLGSQLLEKYALTPEAQQRARRAAEKTLELASQVRLLTTQKLGVACFPGC
ncbi:MAG: ferritin-like domain-containing protein [Acidobacteria bacterium]|nr:ferritin-like domain-containing protein [Acidobacteriota bacterium]